MALLLRRQKPTNVVNSKAVSSTLSFHGIISLAIINAFKHLKERTDKSLPMAQVIEKCNDNEFEFSMRK